MYFVSESKKYTFIKSRLETYPLASMCRVMNVHRSGFYEWVNKPYSKRTIDNKRLLDKLNIFV